MLKDFGAKAGVLGLVAAAGANDGPHVVRSYDDSGPTAGAESKKAGGDVVLELDENELMERRVQLYILAYGALDRTHVFLVDQNFNIITGAAIAIPEEILSIQDQKKRESAFQEWINKIRTELKAKYPTIECDTDPSRPDGEQPELVSIRPTLLKIPPEFPNQISYIRANAKLPVHPGTADARNRYQFIKDATAASGLPPGLQAYLPGIVGVESSYRTGLVSDKKAVGPWQITPPAGIDCGVIGEREVSVEKTIKYRCRRGKCKEKTITKKEKKHFDERDDFDGSTAGAIRFINSMYIGIKDNPSYKKIAARYGLTREEDLLFPCVIDAYHSGQGRVTGMLKWFAEEVTEEFVKSKIGNPPYGKDIYSLMSCEYVKSGKDSQYWRKSRNYQTEVAAVAHLLASDVEEPPELEGTYTPPAVNEKSSASSAYASSSSSHTEWSWPVGAVAAASLGAVALQHAGDIRLTKRQTLAAVVGATAQGMAGRFFGSAIFGGRKNIAPSPREGKEPEVKTGQQEPSQPVAREGKNNFEKVIAELLAGKVHVNANLTDAERSKLRTTRNPQLRQAAIAQNLTSIATFADLQAAKTSGTLVPLQATTELYRLAGVGNPKGGNGNNMDYAHVTPKTVQTLEKIGTEVNKKAHEAGLPAKYRVRLVVTSAARTKEYQQGLTKVNTVASKSWSSHCLGNTIDITYQQFDIVDTGTGDYTNLSLGGDVNKELKIVSGVSAILGKVVAELIDKKEVMAIWEAGNQTALHTMVL